MSQSNVNEKDAQFISQTPIHKLSASFSFSFFLLKCDLQDDSIGNIINNQHKSQKYTNCQSNFYFIIYYFISRHFLHILRDMMQFRRVGYSYLLQHRNGFSFSFSLAFSYTAK